MPFESGNQEHLKRTTHGGGRPPNDTHQRLQADLEEAWPQPARIALLKSLFDRANADKDNAAARLLMAYTYGRPGAFDEIKLQEQLEKEVETILLTLEENLSPSAWSEVRRVLRLE